MALYTVATGNTINALDVNQIVNVLQKPSGATEAGKYFLGASIYTNGALASMYVLTLSRNATPVSVSIDTLDQAPVGGMGAMATANLTQGGFQLYSLSGTTQGVNARAGGNWTVQY